MEKTNPFSGESFSERYDALEKSRELLAKSMGNANLDASLYEELLVNYLNAFNECHFVPGRRCHFASYEEWAEVVASEARMITRTDICIADATTGLRAYDTDEHAVQIHEAGYSALGRALTLALVHVIDESMPFNRQATSGNRNYLLDDSKHF